MKKILAISILLLNFSCSKYKLNQPCTLAFQTDYISASNTNDEKFSGTLNITRLTFMGKREKGDPVEIEKEFNNHEMKVGNGIAFDTPIDIPVGKYSEQNVKIRLSNSNSLRIFKNDMTGVNKPVIIEINSDLDLLFTAESLSAELEKEKNYKAKLIWNFNLLFAGISNQGINNGTITVIDGVETIVISSNSNVTLLEKIILNLPKSFQLKIE